MQLTTKITWIGLGHMGTPMAMNLIKGGFDVAVYNRSAEKAAPFTEIGIKRFATLGEVVPNSDVVFTMLSDDAAISSVYADLMKSDVSNKLFINMSTISPALTINLSEQIESRGGHYLDAPVSGSVKPATDGTLLILVAGREANYMASTMFFEKLGKRSLYLGEVGLAAKAKLAINYYMSVLIEGLAETVLFAEKNGIDRETMLSIVNESACGSGMSNMKTPSIIKDDYPAAFPLRHMHKDILLAGNEGLTTEVSKAMASVYGKAMKEDLADKDLMAVIKAVENEYFT